MDKDWHIYWQNPGDSGEPPVVHWQLPEGVTAGALQWPLPVRLATTAGTDYGYQGSTILLSNLSIPVAVRSGSDLPVAATVSWLACHDTCIPQRAQLKATLRIANPGSLDSNAHALLTAASQELPAPLPANFHLSARSSSSNLHLGFTAPGPVSNVIFFPANPEQIDNSAPRNFR